MKKNKLMIEYVPNKTWKNSKIESVEKIKIGIIDGAVNNALFNDYIEYVNFTENNDENFNATHSAVIGSIIKDIYPSSELYISQVNCDEGSPEEESIESIMRALEWLIKKEVKIINMSLGFYKNCKGGCMWEERLKILQERYGVIIVVAGGNTKKEHPNHSISCPGCSLNVITVGSLNRELYIDENMNLKPLPEREKPDLYVNGYVNVKLLDDSVSEYPGTSFSAPIIVGLIAKYYREIVQDANINRVLQVLTGIERYLEKYKVDYDKQNFKDVMTSLSREENFEVLLINNKNIINFFKEMIQYNHKMEKRSKSIT